VKKSHLDLSSILATGSRVPVIQLILVLAYRVLPNTGWYWGGLSIGRYFFDCEIQYRYPLTKYKWSPSAAVCCLSCDQTAVSGGQWPLCNDNYLYLLANSGKTRSGVGAPVERSPFMRDWKDYPLSAMRHFTL